MDIEEEIERNRMTEQLASVEKADRISAAS